MSQPNNENFELQQRFWAQIEERSIPIDSLAVPKLRVFLSADHIRTGHPRVPLLTDEVDLSLVPVENHITDGYQQSA